MDEVELFGSGWIGQLLTNDIETELPEDNSMDEICYMENISGAEQSFFS